MVRILQIGNLIPPHSTENHLKEAMEALGHRVATLQEQDIAGWTQVADLVGIRPPDRLPEIVVWTRTKSLTEQVPIEIRWNLVNTLRDHDIPLIGVHLDRWWGLARESDLTSGDPYFSPAMTVLFTADGGHNAEWASIEVDHCWFQPAVSHVEANRQGVWREDLCSPIAFVGSWQDYHPEWAQRRQLIEHLIAKYPDRLALWPMRGQPGIRGQELCDLYESTCIVVGDSCLAPAKDGTPIKNYWSDRVPETIGRGGFLLHPWVEGIERYYEDGKHLRLYHSMGELDALIDYYLAHDDERLAIAVEGQRHVRENHTYMNRMREVLNLAATPGDNG